MKNNSKIKLPSVNNKDLPILLCPKCCKHIPYIKVVSDEGEILLHIECYCSNEVMIWKLERYLDSLPQMNKSQTNKCSREGHSQFKAMKYCSICQLWMCQDCLVFHNETSSLHPLQNKVLNLGCKIHKKEIIQFCRDCNQSMCIQCEQNHPTHQIQLVDKNAFESFIEDTKSLTNIIATNKNHRDKFNKMIGSIIAPFQQWKQSINKAYDINKQTNIKLKELCQLMMTTGQMVTTYPSYLFNQSLSSLIINKPVEIEINAKEAEKSHMLLKKYYAEEYILKIEEKSAVNEVDLETILIKRKQINQHTHKCIVSLEKEEAQALIQLQDGRLASGSYKKIKLWNVLNFKCLRSINAHSGIVNALIQLQDERLLSGGYDGKIKLWDILSFECLFSIETKTSCVNALIQLNDGRLVSGVYDKMIKLWDVSTLKCLQSIDAHSTCVTALIQLQDGGLVSGGYDKMIKLWNISTSKCIQSTQAHSNYVTILIQLLDGKLISGGLDNLIKLWDVSTFECLLSIETHSNYVTALIQLQYGRLVFGFLDKTIELRDVSTLKCLQSIEAHSKYVSALTQLQDGRLVSSSSDNHYLLENSTSNEDNPSCIQIWDV